MAEMEMIINEEIGIGEDVTQPLTPIACSLRSSFLDSHCSSCFSPLPPFPFPPSNHDSATATTSVLYCSPLCSSSDSPLHLSSSESHILSLTPSSSLADSDLRLSLRLLSLLSPPHFPSSATASTSRISRFLTNHERLMTDDEMAQRIRDGARIIAAARQHRNEEHETKEDELWLEEAILCLVLTNAVEVQDNEGCSLGIALYGTGFSWINHSCSPNACYRFMICTPDHQLPPVGSITGLRIVPSGNSNGESSEHSNFEFRKGCCEYGPRVIVRSIKRIEKGKEITVAYTALLQPKEIRQLELWSKYRFVCHCTRCSASPIPYVDHMLQDIAVSDMGSLRPVENFYRNEASRMLADYVDEVIDEYLTVGDPEYCCERLERLLLFGLLYNPFEPEGQLKLKVRLHPLHHLALNAYTALASAYKIRASHSMPLHSEINDHSLMEDFSMLRKSAAYSLFIASATHHMFCFESSLILSMAMSWKTVGESLLSLARCSAWSVFQKPLPSVSIECSECSLLNRLGTGSSPSQTQDRELELELSESFECINNLTQKVWSSLTNGCLYLRTVQHPLDFSWLERLPDIYSCLGHISMSPNMSTGEIHGLEAKACYNEERRANINQLGVHCLLYGAALLSTYYGENSTLPIKL